MSEKKRTVTPTGIQRVINEGAPMLNVEVEVDVEPHGQDPNLFGEEGTDVGKPPHRRRATRADIQALGDKLGEQVQNWIDVDKAEHASIRTETAGALSEFNARIGNLSNKIDENKKTNDQQNNNILNKLGEVAIESAKTATHVGHLVPEFERERNAKSRLQTASQELSMNDQAKEKDFKRELWKKFWVGVIGIAIAIAGAFVEHYVIHPKHDASPAPAAATPLPK